MTEQSTITIDPESRPFYQGAAAGSRIRDEHDPVHDLAGSDAAARSRMFWFYAGALAAGEYQITDPDRLATFSLGVASRAPENDTVDDVPEDWPETLTGAQQRRLDSLVHDHASKVASNKNNEGHDEQLMFLLKSGWTLPQVLRAMGRSVGT